jgi:hypothetical protein
MADDWHDYFFMLGTAAASLIGLMFVVVTLTAGQDRQRTERGKHLYTSPVVWNLGVVLLLSGAAIAPTVSTTALGIVTAVASIIGIALSIRSSIGIARIPMSGEENNTFDLSWYGIVPGLVYLALGCTGVALAVRLGWAPTALATALIALLLVSIHAEWDLATFLAPQAPSGGEGNGRN